MNKREVPVEIRDSLEGKVDSFKLENFGLGAWAYEYVRRGSELGFSPWEPSSEYPWIVKPFLDDISNYDCFEAAIRVAEALRYNKPELSDFSSRIGSGRDMYGLFEEHYYNVLSWKEGDKKRKLVVDAVPLYPFYGAAHSEENIMNEQDFWREMEVRCGILSFNNSPPLTTLVGDDATSMSSLHIHSPLMQPSSKADALTMYNTPDILMVYSISTIKNGKVKANALCFKLDYHKFMESGLNEEFDKISGEEAFRLLVQENIMVPVANTPKPEILGSFPDHKILSLEEAFDFQIFQRDIEHIGGYARACLSNYRKALRVPAQSYLHY